MTTDELYMARCIQLARNGEIYAAPNPMVGAVIVCDGRIIGEGYHARCGEPHAEVNAFGRVKDESLLARSTLYVSLEPCAHYGRTPPCAELIVRKGVRRVVVGCVDPFAKVQGRGIEIIRRAGIEVEVGVLERECRELNRRFFTAQTQQRPYITLKWAQTADGIMGVKDSAHPGRRLLISNKQTSRRVHHLRATHSSILVGYNTALFDNPSLTTRLVDGPDPLRVVFDPRGALPSGLRLFDGTVPTLVAGYVETPLLKGRPNVDFLKLSEDLNPYRQILAELHSRNIQSLLVEGGRAVLQSFIDLNLFDEIHVEQSAREFRPADFGPTAVAVEAPSLNRAPDSSEELGDSRILHFSCQTI